MISSTFEAYGKLNLTLDVLKKRPDGFHEMKMIMQTVSLCDRITLELDTGKPWQCTCSESAVPTGEGNLAYRAAKLFYEKTEREDKGLSIHIEKHIPMQAGMAGGSADAAAVLHGLNTCCGYPLTFDELTALGEKLGADVPYCLLGGTALAEGKGEKLTSLPFMPECTYLLIKPEFSVSTAELFSELDHENNVIHPDTDSAICALCDGDLPALARLCANSFQPLLEKSHPEIRAICEKLLSSGALGASLTGTGSVVFGIFGERESAKKCQAAFSAYQTFLAENV